MSRQTVTAVIALGVGSVRSLAHAQDTREGTLTAQRAEKARIPQTLPSRQARTGDVVVRGRGSYPQARAARWLLSAVRLPLEAGWRRRRHRRRLASRSLQSQRAGNPRRRHLDAQLPDAAGGLLAALPRAESPRTRRARRLSTQSAGRLLGHWHRLVERRSGQLSRRLHRLRGTRHRAPGIVARSRHALRVARGVSRSWHGQTLSFDPGSLHRCDGARTVRAAGLRLWRVLCHGRLS